jgi:hypothetical protein
VLLEEELVVKSCAEAASEERSSTFLVSGSMVQLDEGMGGGSMEEVEVGAVFQ